MEPVVQAGTEADDPDSPWFCPLPQYGVLALSGADAGKLLHGQCTSDILGLDEEHARMGAFCNAKGRVIADFRVFRRAGTYYVLLPLELAPDMEQRLRRVILRAAVKLEDVSQAWRIFGAGGNLAAGGGLFGLTRPLGTHVMADSASGYVMGVAGGRILALLATGSEFDGAWPGCVQVDPARWLLEDVRAGIGHITAATSEEFIPQMINLDLLEAISFNKGCYIGQEIVARTHYLGQIKRRMFRLQCGQGSLKSGTALFLHGKPGQSVGMVVQAAPTGEGGQELLAVVATDAIEGSLHVAGAEGPALSILPLPYAFLNS